MNKKTTELKTVLVGRELYKKPVQYDGYITVSEITGEDGKWRCTFECDVEQGVRKTVHEEIVSASNVVEATFIYQSAIPLNLRGSFDPSQLPTDCKHCGAPVGECDGNCDALPNELDDASENVG